jgi:alkaline phosphatase D
MELAVALGATAAWGHSFAAASNVRWRERRDLFPEGVASGDPDSDSVLLWTRCPQAGEDTELRLKVEVAEDEAFRRMVATAEPNVSAASDWTCRVLVGGLKPAHVYWYRFSNAEGFGSRIGLSRRRRWMTAGRFALPL